MNLKIEIPTKIHEYMIENGKPPKHLIVSDDMFKEIANTFSYCGYLQKGDHDMCFGLIISQVSHTITNFLEVA